MKIPFVIGLILLFIGCRGEEDVRTDASPPYPAPEQPSVEVARPGSLRIEGLEQPVTLYRFDDPDAPFVTFIPERDFQGGTTTGGTGRAVRFVSNFGGTTNTDAYATFFFPANFFYPEGVESATISTLRDYLIGENGLAASNGWIVNDDIGATPCLWAAEGYTYRDVAGGAAGMMCIGEHGGRPFYLLTHVPNEMQDGFGPRLDVLLDNFRWRDDNSSLNASDEGPTV